MIWKILFVIYAVVFTLMSFFNMDTAFSYISTSNLEDFVNRSIEVVLVFAFIYTFSLGWDKKLIGEKLNKYFFRFSLFAFALVGGFLYVKTYAPMYNEMLLHAMREGMVPRHWDFQMLLAMTRIEALILVLIALFVIFTPFYLGYYHYTKRINTLHIAQNSGRKCFAVYAIFSYSVLLTAMFLGVSGNIVNFNIFDCLSVLSSIYISLGLFGYAFKHEILNQTFWRIMLPLCIFVEVLPQNFFSVDFQQITGMMFMMSSPIYLVSSYALTIVAIFMLYRYAFTNAVFQEEKSN